MAGRLLKNISARVNNRTPIGISPSDFRGGIMELQAKMLEMPQIEPETSHYFANGVYAREMRLKKGEVVVGKIHRHAHINILSQGCVDVMCEFGVARYEAPYTFVSEEWTKRIIMAVEDSAWTTIHATDTEDLDEIEKQHIVEDYEVKPCHG